MTGNTLYDNEKEQRYHRTVVENLAQNLDRSVEGVNTLYKIVLTRYKRTARIKDFLSPLVAKRVKELLKDDTPLSDIEGRRSHSSVL
jgi:isochorismate synthase EntC